MTSGVYEIRHKPSGRVYIGSSVNAEKRWRIHQAELAKGSHHSPLLQRAWVKYGADAFVFTILEQVGETTLLAREQWWIDITSCTDPRRGFNISPVAGSVRGLKWSPEARERIREARRRTGISSACREAQRQAMSGDRAREAQKRATEARYRNGNAGKQPKRWKNTPENRAAHLAALAEAARGKPLTEEHRRRISEAQRGRAGREWTDEQRAKVSAAHKGRVVTEETRARLRAAWQRRRAAHESHASRKEGSLG